MREPSEWFREVFMGCGGGSPTLVCGCGRTNFSDSRDYSPGEHDRIVARAKLEPDRYVHHSGMDSCIGYDILSRFYVYGCTCEYAVKAEDGLWQNRADILQYISRRNADELSAAQKLSELASGAMVGIGAKP